jgi:phage shock protein C
MEKKLYRSRIDNKIAGVCGGLGEYFNVDPTFVRIAMVLLVFAHGIGLIAYIISWIVMPLRPILDTAEPQKIEYSSANKFLPGVLLIAVGLVFLMNNLWWWFDFWYLWPIILVALGAYLIFGATRRQGETNNGTQPTEVGQ